MLLAPARAEKLPWMVANEAWIGPNLVAHFRRKYDATFLAVDDGETGTTN